MPPSASALSPPRATRSRTRTRDRGDSSPPPASERRPARSGGPDSDVRELLEGATYDVEPVPAPPAPPTAAELALVAEFSPVVR
ncbi:MAG: hypothetical protein FJ104_08405, partial [Deltaproteobacteria bacterium]|nr:hypothetical protein [Deltaproteobacteria bacterium]